MTSRLEVEEIRGAQLISIDGRGGVKKRDKERRNEAKMREET
jgi:hypothetical protein